MASSAVPPLWAGLAPPTFCSENAFFLVDHLHHTYDSAVGGEGSGDRNTFVESSL